MAEYLTPGVYIEEIDGGSKPIEGVGVNTAAFVGYAKSGEFNKPTFVSSWTEFTRIYGDEDAIIAPALAEELGTSPIAVLTAKLAAKPTMNWIQFADREFQRRVRDGKWVKGQAKTWAEFLNNHGLRENRDLTFSPYLPDAYLAYCVKGFFDNGGDRCYIVRVARESDLKPFLNGKKTKAIASQAHALVEGIEVRAKDAGDAANGTTVTVTHKGDDGFLLKVDTPDGQTEIVGTERQPLTIESIKAPVKSKFIEFASVQTETRPAEQTFTLTGGMAASDSKLLPLQLEYEKVEKESLEEIVGDEAKRTGFRGLVQIEDINMISAPDIMAGLVTWEHLGDGVQIENISIADEQREKVYSLQKQMISYCEGMGDRMAILDSLPGLDPDTFRREVINTYNLSADHGQAAIYYPWIRVEDQTLKDPDRTRNKKYYKLIPPSGHVAGVWARVGKERGVHKAPANEPLRSAVSLERDVTHSEQGLLNFDGLNVIRTFPGRGIRIWGARTLATVGNASWKYVNVRRLFNFLEKSMDRGMQWAVFEPNDDDLWARVRRNLSAFLWVQWKEGMLFGATPDEAFYVKCDRETNTTEMIDLGRLYVEIGINPVKPAEFVIVRIGQWDGGAEKAYS